MKTAPLRQNPHFQPSFQQKLWWKTLFQQFTGINFFPRKNSEFGYSFVTIIQIDKIKLLTELKMSFFTIFSL